MNAVLSLGFGVAFGAMTALLTVFVVDVSIKMVRDRKKRRDINNSCLRDRADMLEKNGGPDPCKNPRPIPPADDSLLSANDLFMEMEEQT